MGKRRKKKGLEIGERFQVVVPGSRSLVETLADVAEHIRDKVPELKKRLSKDPVMLESARAVALVSTARLATGDYQYRYEVCHASVAEVRCRERI